MSFNYMSQFVKMNLYEELIKMPLWVVAAFSNKDIREFYLDEIRVQLIASLVIKVMDRCPIQLYNNDYRHNWKTQEYINLVKDAYTVCLKSLVNYPHMSYVSSYSING